MKARLVRPAFWSDSISVWPAELRLFYIGTWCLADDDGYLRFDITSMAAELYPLKNRVPRERLVAGLWQSLVDNGKAQVLRCGRHARVPSVEYYRTKAGTASYTIRDEHRRRCKENAGSSKILQVARVESRVESLEIENEEENELEVSNRPFSELVPRPGSKR